MSSSSSGSRYATPSQNSTSLDRDRVDRRAQAADERLRRGLEQELVDAVVRAVGGQLLEVEVLALGHPHLDEVQEVHRERQVGAFARVDLEREAVGRERGDVVVAEPLDRLQRGPRV